MRAFDGSNLILDQLQALALSLELCAQQRRDLVAMSAPPPRPLATADDDTRTQVVQYQQSADTVRMSDALMRQTLQLSMLATCILGFWTWLAQHAPDSFAGVMTNEHCQEFVCVQPVRLGPTRTAVDLNTCRVDDDVIDTQVTKPTMEPPAVSTGFVDAVHERSTAKLEASSSLDDAVGYCHRIARGDGVPAHAGTPVTEAEMPLLVTQIEAHVQGCAGSRILAT